MSHCLFVRRLKKYYFKILPGCFHVHAKKAKRLQLFRYKLRQVCLFKMILMTLFYTALVTLQWSMLREPTSEMSATLKTRVRRMRGRKPQSGT